jgi:hypothetical protein
MKVINKESDSPLILLLTEGGSNFWHNQAGAFTMKNCIYVFVPASVFVTDKRKDPSLLRNLSFNCKLQICNV